MIYYTFETYMDNCHLHDKINKCFKNKDNAIAYITNMLNSLETYQWFYPVIKSNEKVRPANKKVIVDGNKIILSAEVECQILESVKTTETKTIEGKVYSREETSHKIIKDWHTRIELLPHAPYEVPLIHTLTIYIKEKTLTLEDDLNV